MDNKEPQAIIELDDIKIKCLIFQINDNNDAEILSTSIKSSDGIQNDIIINLEKASNAIRSCISEAEKKAKISLKKIYVVLEQPDFLCTRFSKKKKIDGSQIYKDDIDFLLKEAKKQLLLNDMNQSIIHIFNHNYVVDGKTFIEEPIGVFADSLTHEMSFITTFKNNVKNINQVLNNCEIEIERLISRTFVLGAELFKDNELQNGATLVNMGYEKTSIGLFKNLALIHSATLPFGTNHITKDISKVCSLSLNESINIRNAIDFSFQNNHIIFDENNFLKKNYFINSSYRKISKELILGVTKSRIEEIFEKTKQQFIVPKLNLSACTNFLLISEENNLANIEKNYENYFQISVKKINNSNEGIKNFFSSCLGAIKIIKDGWETEAIPKIKNNYDKKAGFFSKIFRKW